MTSSSVSVVIPCYNGAKFLRNTLQSAIGQTHSPAEIIVIDDGSTDNSAAIAESFGRPVRVIRQTNQGESVARNRGMDEAKGHWIAFLDADDSWEPTKLARQLAAASAGTIAVGAGSCYHFDNSSMPDRLFRPPEPANWVEFGVSFGSPCPISTLMVRKSVKARFPTWTIFAEDCLFEFDLAYEGEVVVLAEPLATYLCHAASQSRRRKLIQFDYYQSIDTWLQTNKGRFDADSFRQLRLAAGKRLVEACESAYTIRDWKSHEEMMHHLSQKVDLPELIASVRRRKVPRFVYTAYDFARPVISFWHSTPPSCTADGPK